MSATRGKYINKRKHESTLETHTLHHTPIRIFSFSGSDSVYLTSAGQ